MTRPSSASTTMTTWACRGRPVELQTDVDRLLELRDPHLPPRTVPHGAVALTCGIDVQKRGFWYLVRAWMPTMASYVIDYGYLGSWDDVQALVFDTCYPVQGPDGSDVGERMPIWRACIDSGGTETRASIPARKKSTCGCGPTAAAWSMPARVPAARRPHRYAGSSVSACRTMAAPSPAACGSTSSTAAPSRPRTWAACSTRTAASPCASLRG